MLVPSAYSGSVGGIVADGAGIIISDVNVTAAGVYHSTCGCGSGECVGAQCESFRAYLTQSGAGVEGGARFLADHRRFDYNNSELVWTGRFDLSGRTATFRGDVGIVQGVSVRTGDDFEVTGSGASGETAFIALENDGDLVVRDSSVSAGVTCSGRLAGLVGSAKSTLRVAGSSVSGRLQADECAALVVSGQGTFYGTGVRVEAALKGKRAAQGCLDAYGVFQLFASELAGQVRGETLATPAVGVARSGSSLTLQNLQVSTQVILSGNGEASGLLARAEAGAKLTMRSLALTSNIDEGRALRAGSVVAFLASGVTVSHSDVRSLTTGQYCQCGSGPLSEVGYTPAQCTH